MGFHTPLHPVAGRNPSETKTIKNIKAKRCCTSSIFIVRVIICSIIIYSQTKSYIPTYNNGFKANGVLIQAHGEVAVVCFDKLKLFGVFSLLRKQKNQLTYWP